MVDRFFWYNFPIIHYRIKHDYYFLDSLGFRYCCLKKLNLDLGWEDIEHRADNKIDLKEVGVADYKSKDKHYYN